jgi:alkylation response protein AidB-like acyl-CoA dehydrogenase
VLEACRVARLTRNQHILFRLGELITHAECAEAFAQRAATALDGARHEKSPDRFDGAALAAMSRVFAREAAQKVGQEGVRWVAGSIVAGSADVAPLLATIPHDAIRSSQAGLLADMDLVADVLYGRTA